MPDLKAASYRLLVKNRRYAGTFQYTIPSRTSYPYQWLWDSCFHAIVLAHFHTPDAKKELLALVSHQFENGMIPHMIYWEKPTVINLDWGRKGTSTITQPPMLAYAVWYTFKKDADKEFLARIYPHLYHYYRYLLYERDPRRNHLIGLVNPDESGEDNSPRFDIPLGLPPRHTLEENTKRRFALIDRNKACNFDAPFCMKNFFWVKDVPFNAVMVENLRILADIADALGYRDDAFYFKQEQLSIAAAMRALMVEEGIFWSTYGAEYKKIKVKTWAIFSPLFAQMISREEARRLVQEHLLNSEEFLSTYPTPTVAKNDPAYDPEGFWRGPTWIVVNWFIFHGLLKYGFVDVAERIYRSSCDLLIRSGFREQFHPDTGEGLGAKDFTWGTLVVDMEAAIADISAKPSSSFPKDVMKEQGAKD